MPLLCDLLRVILSPHRSRRALAAAFKVRGWVLQRRWPLLRRASGDALNLDFLDLLHLQRTRRRDFTALVVGAFDGLANDPAGQFLSTHAARAVFVEPQEGPCRRLADRLGGDSRFTVVRAAVDQWSGSRLLHVVRALECGLPDWTEQIASFDPLHAQRHEERAPGVGRAVVRVEVPTVRFEDLLSSHALHELDLLQIDTEGMDAQLLEWFPWAVLRPGVLHYEVAHMPGPVRAKTSCALQALGYQVFSGPGDTDDMAILG